MSKVRHSPEQSCAVELACRLVRCRSVTPADAGALDVLEEALKALGFMTRRYPFGSGQARIDNLYARLGSASPNFCYAGHTDVVPAGDESRWSYPPFDGDIADGQLWGRGTADMKGGIAAFVAATAELLESGWTPKGSISLLITGDEEGPAINGTRKFLPAIYEDGEEIDHCLVGEPTNPDALGDMVKNGRRGSLNGKITVTGKQGHVAYPDRASNPVPALMALLTRLTARKLDGGNKFFQPSNLEVTSIDVGNTAHNVIAEAARAQFNIRFNTEHFGDDLKEWIREEARAVGENFDGQIDLDLAVTGEAFMTEPCGFTDLVQDAVQAVTGRRPQLSTSGGTSDARFITHYAPVVEFGLIGATIHQVDEHAALSDINQLAAIYGYILQSYFK